jgi:hypothetical protein
MGGVVPDLIGAGVSEPPRSQSGDRRRSVTADCRVSAAGRADCLAGSMENQRPSNDSYLKLVTANVLRLRRQFDLAEAQCSEVLRRAPSNAGAHSVMGDIARDKGKLKDAIEWYKLALDLDPGNVSDRHKLEAVIDKAYPREKVGPVERLRENVTGQLESTAAEMRAARLPPAAYLALGAMLAVIIGVTVVVLALGHRAAPATAAIAEGQPSGAFVSAPLQPQQAAETPATTGPATEPRFAEKIGDLETALLGHLKEQARVVDPNCRVVDAEIDPRDGGVSVRLSMPRVWSAEETRKSILRVAVALARAAATWDERVSAVRVRCDSRQEGQTEERAFVGQADLGKLSVADQDPGAKDGEQAFSSVWWSPQLAPSPETAPAGAPQ